MGITQTWVYGFGSFFKSSTHNDIDILVLHESTDTDSCNFALTCKKVFELNLTNTHITVLSIHEEKQFNFLKITDATFLGSITAINFKDDIEKVISTLHSYNNDIVHTLVHFHD